MKLNRKVTLEPKTINLRVEDRMLSINYRIRDDITGIGFGDTWVNFTPSDKLIEILKTEVNEAIKNYKK